MATKLETSLEDRPVQFVVKQYSEDSSLIYVEVCKRDAVDKLLNRIKDDRFIEGPDPSRLICLREGDQLEVNFRDNIHFEDRTSRRFVYNSNLSCANLKVGISELDPFAQNALEFYRGYIRLSLVGRPYQAPPKLDTYFVNKRNKTSDDGLICELQLTLSKVRP